VDDGIAHEAGCVQHLQLWTSTHRVIGDLSFILPWGRTTSVEQEVYRDLLIEDLQSF